MIFIDCIIPFITSDNSERWPYPWISNGFPPGAYAHGAPSVWSAGRQERPGPGWEARARGRSLDDEAVKTGEIDGEICGMIK